MLFIIWLSRFLARWRVALPSWRCHQSVWLHAASAGELESLWPLVSHFPQVIVTVMSPSGRLQLQQLANEQHGIMHYQGFLEGSWGKLFDAVQPSFFLTVKYEAWPELWASLAERKIPLFILGARIRPSLRWIKRLLPSHLIPKITFLTSDDETKDLAALFPQAQFHQVGDPRWDRVQARRFKGHPRAKEFLSFLQGRKVAILGSTWPEDLQLWAQWLKKQQSTTDGSVWLVVPHASYAGSLPCTKGREPFYAPVLCVNEVGFLAELYAAAEWAYIGGGFTAGVHSCLEPALYGIRVACGPYRAESFSEIAQLKKRGQLTIVRNAEEIGGFLSQQKSTFAMNEFFGATNRVLDVLGDTYASS